MINERKTKELKEIQGPPALSAAAMGPESSRLISKFIFGLTHGILEDDCFLGYTKAASKSRVILLPNHTGVAMSTAPGVSNLVRLFASNTQTARQSLPSEF